MENRVHKIHERALRLVYDDSRNFPFEELLVKDNRVSIHQKISKLLLQKSLKQKKDFSGNSFRFITIRRGHPFSTYTIFSEKLTFLTP